MNAAFAIRMERFLAITGMTMALSSIQVSARVPPSVQKRGVIEMIDRNARALRLRVKPDGSLLALVWTPQTRIFEGTRAAIPADLRKGASVTVWYHHPVFAELFATKILIEAESGHSLQTGRSRSTSTRP